MEDCFTSKGGNNGVIVDKEVEIEEEIFNNKENLVESYGLLTP